VDPRDHAHQQHTVQCRALGVTGCPTAGHARRKVQPSGFCAGCTRERAEAARRLLRLSTVREQYNITHTRYEALWRYQGGRCFICRRPGKTKQLAIDHDHRCCNRAGSCGKCVRGLLCGPCNRFLGHLKDDPEAARRMWVYLLQPPAMRPGLVYGV
jgi:hypothetical protein